VTKPRAQDDHELRQLIAQLVVRLSTERSAYWQYRFGCVFLHDTHGICVARLYADGSIKFGEPDPE
jgi:hypothetical protein